MVTPAPTSFDPAARIGTVVAGKYRLERLLGAGGMGAVYEAVHAAVQRRFAVKIMTADPTRSPEAVRRFTQEAQAAGLIGHPNIVEVFDLGEGEDGTLYMVMELLSGATLHEVLRDGPLAEADAVAIAVELLRALDAAHKAGVVHRDVKPQNLFLAERASGDGATLKVLDFGIAKFHEPDASTITRSGAIVGTPLYMAPEQVLSDRELDGRVDVWAAGATLFEMLAGRPVHLAPHAAAAAVRIVTEPAPRIASVRGDVRPELDAIVARALSISREDRYATAGEMADALEAITPSLSQSQRAPLVTPSARPRVPSSGALRATPEPARRSGAGEEVVVPTPAPVAAVSPPSAKNGVLLLGAVAVVFGAAATIALLPMGATTKSDPSAGPTVSASATIAPPPPVSLAKVDLPPVDTSPKPATDAPLAPSATASAPAGRATESARPTASVVPPIRKPDPPRPIKPEPSATPLACGAREVASNGHCCPIGMVWRNDRCDRPVATTF